MEGLVVKSTGSWYEVTTAKGAHYRCRIRGKLRIAGIKVTNPVAVGDIVLLSPENDHEAIIEKILPRRNYLIRRSIRKKAHGHILAANIDQAVLVATITFPRTSMGFIDRFLVAAESFRIPSLLVFNKSDMWDDEMQRTIKELEPVYTDIGVKFLTMSATRGINLELFRDHLKNKISLIAGHSGVGKSTILNAMDENIDQKIGEVSSFANKGTHTTTFAEMFDMGDGVRVIDTPGIKELGLLDFYDEEICHFFPEMRDLFGKCKYYNCTHTHEPGCAVIDAVKKGIIAWSRFESYLGIIEEEETHR
jgi:ribosome biogenesis GTPase